MFADLKNFIASKMCKNLNEVREAISLYERNIDLNKIRKYFPFVMRFDAKFFFFFQFLELVFMRFNAF